MAGLRSYVCNVAGLRSPPPVKVFYLDGLDGLDGSDGCRVFRWFRWLATSRMVCRWFGCGLASAMAVVFFPAFQKIRQTTPRKKLPALLISVPRYLLLRRPRADVVGAGAGASSTSDTKRVGLLRPGRK